MRDQELEALLRELIAIPSVFPEEQTLSAWMATHLRDSGFQVEVLMTEGTRPNLIARNHTNSEAIGFYGHLDTVPADPTFSFDPLKMQIDGERARGLGVADMKGGNACILLAARWAASRGLPVTVVFGVDEEDYSRGAHDLCSSGKLHDLKFLVVAESGQIQDTSIPYSVGYGRKGRIGFSATVRGKTSHAAVATSATNAISQAAAFVSAVDRHSLPEHTVLGRARIVWHRIQAETDSFSAPGSCALELSALTVPGFKSDDVERLLREIAHSTGVELELFPRPRPTPAGNAYEIDRINPFLRELEAQVFLRDGVTPAYFTSVADENVFAHRLQIPVLTLGPVGMGEHSKDEWVSLLSLAETRKVYQELIERYSQFLRRESLNR
jgi:acetylornithine deacetylase/succinyl-diaminopimelate desuccinylase-like protein